MTAEKVVDSRSIEERPSNPVVIDAQGWLKANGPGGWIDNLREENKRLRDLLMELIDIESPQPGHVMWFRKVQAALGVTADETEGGI